MSYYSYYTPNQYRQNQDDNSTCYYWCPMMRNYFKCNQPNHYSHYNIAPAIQPAYREYNEGYSNNDNNQMTKQEVDMVVDMVKKDQKNLINDIQQFIKDSKLLNYVLIALVSYICFFYNKYKDVIDEKTDELVEDLRKSVPWVFDILALFDITPDMVDDFLDNLIRATVISIRKLVPYSY